MRRPTLVSEAQTTTTHHYSSGESLSAESYHSQAFVFQLNTQHTHISPLFLSHDDGTDAQERIIKHLLLPRLRQRRFPSDDPSYLHEYAGGRLSAFLKSDLLKIHPTNNSSSWRRGDAHLINASVKEDASTFFTEEFQNLLLKLNIRGPMN